MYTLANLLIRASKSSHGISFVGASKEDQFLSYKALLDNASKLLGALQSRGLKKGEELVIFTTSNESLLTCFWAGVLGGMIPVPLSAGRGEKHLAKLVSVSKSLLHCNVIVDNNLTDIVGKAFEGTNVGNEISTFDLESLMAEAKEGEIVNRVPTDPGFIQFSSGSTGNPKGILLSHENLYYNTLDIASRAAITDKDVLLSWMPLTHDMGMICCHLTGVAAQANQVLFTTFSFIKTPLLWMEKAHQYRATLLYSPNFGYQYFLQALALKDRTNFDWNLSSIRLFFNGAEMISSKICADFVEELAFFGMSQDVMYPGYGLAEASVAVCLPRINETYKVYPVDLNKLSIGFPIVFNSQDDSSFPLVSLGYPLDHTHLRVTNDADEVLPEGYLGHMQIKGHNVMKSYYDDIHNRGVFTVDGWLRTGDLGFIYNGELVMAGREKNLIIINGQNYLPDDIENTLANHTELTKDKIVASSYFDQNSANEELLIFIVHKTTARHQDAFQHFCEIAKAVLMEKFGLFISSIIAVRQFPKTTSGKIRYKELVEDYRQSQVFSDLTETTPESHGDVESLVRTLLLEITGKEVDEDSHSIVYFMDSLLTIQFVNKLRGAGYVLDTGDIYKSNSLSEIIACIKVAEQYVPDADRKESSRFITLNQSQRRFHLLHQIAEEKCALNNRLRLKIDKAVAISVVEKAAQKLLDNYPVLNGTVKEDKLIIQEFESASVLVIAETESVNASPAFDLEKGPLWQVIFEPATNELWFVVHHIISDGWSLNLIVETFFKALNGEEKQVSVVNRDSFLSKQLSPKPIAAQKQYWQSFLKGTNFNKNLTSKKPIIAEFGVDHAEIEIDSGLLQNLYKVAESVRATPYIMSLSAVFLAVHKLTANQAPVLATNIAAREKPELEDQLGLFMRTLLMREDIDQTATYASFIAAVKRNYLQTLENRDYHYDEVLALKKREFEEIPEALFEILVLYQKFSFLQKGNRANDTIGYTDDTPANPFALSNITCEFIDRGEALVLRTSYRKGLYESSQIHVLNKAIAGILSAMVGNPDQVIESSTLDFKSRLRGSVKPMKTDQDERSVLDQFNFEKHSGQIAIESPSVNLTYQQLSQLSEGLASILASRYGLSANSKVVLLLNNSAEYVVSVFGVWKSGCTFIPIDINYPEERINWMINHCEADLIITNENRFSTQGTQHKKPVYQIDLDQLAVDPLPTQKELKRPGGCMSYIMYTSGTTGTPKGVMVQDHSVDNYIGFFKDHLGLTPADKVIQQSSVAFDTTVEEIFPILSVGGTLVIFPSGNENVSSLVSFLDTYQVSVLTTTPLVISEINKRYFLPQSIRILISGGDYLKPDYLKNIFGKCNLYNSYGPTETTVCATYHHIETLNEAQLIGSPVTNCSIYLVDENEELVSKGTEGEIVITGAQVSNGYFKNQSETRQKFIPNTFDDTSNYAYKTGDLGLIDAREILNFIGRKDRQLKIRGYRVELLEIEQVYIEHEAIEDAIAHVSTSENALPVLVLYYTGDTALPIIKLQKFGAKFLPFYMLPAQYTYLPVLPRTRNGKIDLKKIKALAPAKVEETASNEENDMLILVRKSWKTALEAEVVKDHTNLFEGGGNSLIAVRIASMLGQVLKKHIPLKWIYSYPTVAQLSSHLKDHLSTSFINEIEPANDLSYPLSLSQERLFYLCRDRDTSVTYNESQSFNLEGDLDIELFKQAFQQVIQRHALLRSVIDASNEMPIWKTFEQVPESFLLQEITLVDNESGMDELIQKEAYTAIDFEAGPLYRFKLIETASGSFVLSAVMHHLISDGVTVSIFFNEWKQRYHALTTRTEPAISPLSIQFGDYSKWQRAQLTQPEFEQTDAYWKQKLAGVGEVVRFPFERNERENGSIVGNRMHFEFSREEYDAIRTYCKDHLCTPFVFFSAVLSTLVYKYTGKHDILITYPENGRDHHELKGLIGFFVNTLLLRARVSGDSSFFSLAQQLSEQRLNDTFNLNIPFESLSEYAGVPPADLLNNIVLVMQDDEDSLMKDLSFHGLRLKLREKTHRTTKGNLVFFAEAMSDGSFQFDIEYDTRLFDQQRISRYFSHIQKLVNSALEKPFAPIRELEILPASEKQFVLYDNNLTHRPEGRSQSDTVVSGFEEQVRLQPEAIAVTYLKHSMSFQEVNNFANRIARHLQDDCKVAHASKIAIVQERTPEFLIAILGVLKAGCAYVPISPDFPKNRIEYLLDHSDSSHILSNTTVLEQIENLLYEMPALNSITCIDQVNEDFFREMEQRSEELWDYTAEKATNEQEASGWVSSLTSEAFSTTEISDLIFNVVDQVKPLVDKNSKVLEVGCGSGLVMFNLHGHVKQYVGTDISDSVIKQCQERIDQEKIGNIEVLKLSAIEVDAFEDHSMDLIVLNSVIQYFSHQYLREFLLKAMKLLKPGGHLFIADVRDLSKQRAFYELLLGGVEDLEEQVKQQYLKEDELFLNPAFFTDFFAAQTMAAKVRVTRKKETVENELTRFRYNVLITNTTEANNEAAKGNGKRVFHHADLLKHDHGNLPLVSTGKDIAYVLYTSGTSGTPKGVPIAHEGIYNRLLWTKETFDFRKGDALLQKSPSSFDVSVWEMLFPLTFGYRSVICPKGMVADGPALINYISETGITHAHFVPSLLNVFIQSLENSEIKKVEQLREVFSSGEELLPGTVNDLKALTALKIHNLYGPTEASVDVTYQEALAGKRVIPIGKPISNTRMYMLDTDLNPLPIGVPGDLYIAGLGLTKGYYKNEELTHEKFIENPHCPGEVIYKTGDSAYLNEAGEIIYIGRTDNQIKLRGFRIEPGEIEWRVSQHPAVKVAQSFTIHDHEDKSLCLAIVPDATTALLALNSMDVADESRSFLKELPDGKPFYHPNVGETEFMYREIFQEEIYMHESLRIDEGGTIIDAGANAGMFCTYLSTFYQNLNFYAVEPIPVLNQCLQWNASLYGMNLITIESGLYNEERITSLVYYVNNTITSHLTDHEASRDLAVMFNESQYGGEDFDNLGQNVNDYANEKQNIEVQLTTLSKLLQSNGIETVDLLKLDVEGSELKVLEGVDLDDWAKIRQLIVEVENQDCGRQVMSLLEAKGYTCYEKEHPLMTGLTVNIIYARQGQDSSVFREKPAQLPHLRWVNQEVLKQEVIDYCKLHLPDYMIPDQWLILSHIPMTRHGKADRKLLEKKISTSVPPSGNRASGKTEAAIVEIWEEVLGIREVDVIANFFQIGGHSLKATKLMIALNRLFGTQLRLSQIFENPTVREQAKMVELPASHDLWTIEPAPKGDSYELSRAQQRFWIMELVEENTYASNMPGSVKFTGVLDIPVITDALNLVIKKHESLRTVFPSVKGVPRQVIIPKNQSQVNIELIDLSDATEPICEAREIAQQEAKMTFDLTLWPLYKVKILRVNAELHILLFTIHHIISDGRSLEIIVEEMMEYYNAMTEGKPVAQKHLQIHYKDFAAWQNKLLNDGLLQSQEQYWLSRFAGVNVEETIKPEFARPESFTTSGANLEMMLDNNTMHKALKVRERFDMTEFGFMHGIVNLVVLCHSAKTDVTIGVPFSTRDNEALEDQVGNYLNLLPIRSHLKAEMTFKDYMDNIQQIVMNAFDNNSYPFDLLVEKLELEQHRNRMPLFDIGFTFNHANRLLFEGKDKKIFKNLTVELFENTYQSVKADLWFNCYVQEGGYKFNIEYNSNLFSENKIKQITATIGLVIQQVTNTNDERPVSSIIQYCKNAMEQQGAEERVKVRKKNLSKLIADL